MPRPKRAMQMFNTYVTDAQAEAIAEWAADYGVTKAEAHRALLDAALSTAAARRKATKDLAQ